MPLEDSSDAKFEISHVLFIDIVGYSKLLIHEQREKQRQLNEVVHGTERFRVAKKSRELIRLPGGDGIAMVLRDDPRFEQIVASLAPEEPPK
jgi:hypothetical protein